MALEVGRLVARIDIEGSFEQKLAAAKKSMEDVASAAGKLDAAVGKAGQAGARLSVPDAPKRKLDETAAAATKVNQEIDKASAAGKRLDVSSSAESKLVKLNSTTRDYGLSLGRASEAGKRLDVSDAAQSKMVRLGSTARDYGVSLKAASDAGKGLNVSDAAQSKIVRLSSTTRDYGVSLSEASVKGRALTVSDQPRQKLAETASITEQVDARLGKLGLSLKSVTAMAGGAAGLGTILTKGWDRISSIDTAQGKLRGLGHEAAGVSTIMESALDSVTGTAYGLGDAATIAANAVAAGIKPGQDLTKYLTMTADASAIAGVSLGEMGRILNQVQTGQSAYAGDLSQLADRGIPIYQWLGEEAGVAASEIKKMASTGQISSEMLFSAIQNNIGGAAQEMGGTLVGSLANVGAAFGRLGASAIDPFKDDIMAAAEGAQEFAGTLAGIVGPAASLVAGGLGEVASIVGMIPTPILGATAALVALQQTGLGPKMAGAASTAVGSLRSFGESALLAASYARDGASKNGLFATSLHGLQGAGAAAKKGLGSVVDMLGGPWMIGIAAAGMLIADFVSASKSAADVQKQLADASGRSASAQNELAAAVAAANGAMDEQALAAAQQMVQAEFDKTTAKAEQNFNVFADLRSAINRTSMDYAGFSDAAQNMGSAVGRSAAESEMAKLRVQALGDATKEIGVSMDDVNSIVAKGGQEYGELAVALLRTGDAGAAVLDDFNAVRSEIERTRDAIKTAEPGSHELAAAFQVLGDEASSASDKTKALKQALDILHGGQMSARDAAQAHHDEIRGITEATKEAWDATKGFGDELVRNGNEINTTTENGSKLRSTIADLVDSTLQAEISGSNMAEVWAQNDQALRNLATSTGLPIEKLRELAATEGLVERDITILAALQGGEGVTAELARVSMELEGFPPGKTIEIAAASEEAIANLRAAGWEVDHIPGEKNMKITASTEAARVGLQNLALAALNLDNADPNLNVHTNADYVTAALGLTRDAVEALPNGHIEISDTTPENMRRLEALTGKVHEPKNGVVTINDADVDRARQRVTDLNKIKTQSSHTVNVSVLRHGNDVATDGITVGHHYADGGIRGNLPQQATIAAPQGTRGVVQWAEAETGGEAFIPLAPAKRNRSLAIWKETGRRLGVEGVDYAFADGGIMAGGLINFAKGVEGKPYVWGGVNWGDCSGAVSALANYVSGRSPFGSRFATASQREGLLARGFVMGRGGPGDLRIGWVNGGPGGGHTSATLPNGVNFEMGGARGNGQYGGGAAGADDPQYTDHAYFPMERFADIDAALGEGAMSEIAALLGTGNPEMSPEADTRTQREKNIDAIVAEGQRRGMSDRDIQIALMTAEQESGMRVLANNADPASLGMANEGLGSDHDSVGLFQQRNNGAWGTTADRMDPTRSAGMFYDELAKVQNRESLSLAAAAQAVQKSAHPDAYAKHEAAAASALSESKARLSSMGTGSGAAGGKGLPVYVTNMPAGGFTGGGGGGGGSYSSGGGDAGDVIKEGSIADVLMRAAGLDPTTMFGEPALKGKEKRFDDTKIFEKEGDIEAAKEQARIAQIKLEELKNKRNAKGELVAPSESALAAAELRASEAERKVQKLEHDLRELRLKSQQVRDHNASIGIDVENYADGGFHGLENHSAHIAPNGSYRIFGESETGGEAYIPLASHKRARSTAIWLETGRRLGYGIGAGINLVGSVLTGNGLDTGWGGPGLGDLGIDTNALKDRLAPGLNAEAEKAGQQVAQVLQAFLDDVQKGVSDTLRQVDDGKAQLRQQYARAMI